MGLSLPGNSQKKSSLVPSRVHCILALGVLFVIVKVFQTSQEPLGSPLVVVSDKFEELQQSSPPATVVKEQQEQQQQKQQQETIPEPEVLAPDNPKALHPDKYKFDPIPHPKTTSGKLQALWKSKTIEKAAIEPAKRTFTKTEGPEWDQAIQEMRLAIAMESFHMMMEDTQEQANTHYFVNISDFVALWDTALNEFGVRGAFENLLETQQFSLALTQAAKTLGVEHFYTETTRGGTVAQYMGANQPQLRYRGIPNDHNFYNAFEVCNGCLWWLRHYAGAVTASKLLAEGSLPLDVQEGTKVTKPWDYLEELRRMARRTYADPMDFHAQHGFGWHYLMVEHPDLTEYPMDVLTEWCGDLVWNDEFIEDQNNDIGRECRHTFGHAIYQVLVQKELKAKTGQSKTDVRTQVRAASGFRISEESMCEGYKICLGAPNQSVYNECLGGMRHSHFLYTVGRNGPDEDEMVVIAEEYNRCEQKIGPPPNFES